MYEDDHLEMAYEDLYIVEDDPDQDDFVDEEDDD